MKNCRGTANLMLKTVAVLIAGFLFHGTVMGCLADLFDRTGFDSLGFVLRFPGCYYCWYSMNVRELPGLGPLLEFSTNVFWALLYGAGFLVWLKWREKRKGRKREAYDLDEA